MLQAMQQVEPLVMDLYGETLEAKLDNVQDEYVIL